MFTVEIDGVELVTSYIGSELDEDGRGYRRGYRRRYRWAVGDMESRSDIRSGVGASPDDQQAMGTLLAFLLAAGESYAALQRSGELHDRHTWDGSKASMFRRRVSRWAAEHIDDIAMAELELDA